MSVLGGLCWSRADVRAFLRGVIGNWAPGCVGIEGGVGAPTAHPLPILQAPVHLQWGAWGQDLLSPALTRSTVESRGLGSGGHPR